MSHGGFIFNDCRLGETFLHKTRKPSADGSGLAMRPGSADGPVWKPSSTGGSGWRRLREKSNTKKVKIQKAAVRRMPSSSFLKGKQEVVFSLKSFNFIGRQTGIFNNLVHGLTISLHGTGQLHGGGGFALGASLLKSSLRTLLQSSLKT